MNGNICFLIEIRTVDLQHHPVHERDDVVSYFFDQAKKVGNRGLYHDA
jgi:hypothetical protein